MLNSIVLMGRLAKDPTSFKSGENQVVNFDLAVNNPRKEADGTRETSFFQVKCFGRVAENVQKHLKKGSQIGLLGSIQQRNFLRKDGSKGTAYEVIADSIEFLEKLESNSGKDEQTEEVFNDEDKESESESADEKIKEAQPKFDPFTGKPLKPKSTK